MFCVEEGHRSAGAVLDRIGMALGLASDGEISRGLNIKRSTVGAWRAQNRVPYKLCVELHDRDGINLEWLLLGEGKIRRAESGPASGDYPRVEEQLLHDVANRERFERISGWLLAWWRSASSEEHVWLDVQLRRCLPDYAAWLAEHQPASAPASKIDGGTTSPEDTP